MHAELVKHVLGVGEHVHEMRNRRALIAANIRHARLQQRLGDGENTLAAKLFAVAQLEILHFARKRPFRHENLRADVTAIRRDRPSDTYETFRIVLQRASAAAFWRASPVGTGLPMIAADDDATAGM